MPTGLTDRWRPTRLVVSLPKKRTTSTRPRGPILGDVKLDEDGEPVLDSRGRPVREIAGWQMPGKKVPCWVLSITVDGHEFRERFDKSGHAEAAKLQLEAEFHGGLEFDPRTRRFVRSAPTAANYPTVYTEASAYMRGKWREWEPKTRREGLKALRRACIAFLLPGAPEATSTDLAWLEWILKAPTDGAKVPATASGGDGFWLMWSAPIADVTADDLQSLLERYRVNQRNPARLTSPDTERRFVADLRQFWDDASGRLDFPNPWLKVKLRTKGKGGHRSAVTGPRPVDPDVVLPPTGVWWLAAACATFGSWDAGVSAYVLLMGVCGLRPSETAGVRIEDLELPTSGPGWVTVRRSKRSVADHWLDPDEDPLWGPLKDRDLTESRRVPVPQVLVAYLRDVHIPQHCGRRGLLFQRRGKPYDLSLFDRNVWNPARAAVLPLDPDLAPDHPHQPKLSRLRRHDLRHAACSVWLNTPNVDVKVAQRWSGHRTLSVFLDIYQGIMPGREDAGAAALDARFG
jgi:integrase